MMKLVTLTVLFVTCVATLAKADDISAADVENLIQAKLTATNGPIACKDQQGSAMTMVLGKHVAIFNYAQATSPTNGIPMPQNVSLLPISGVSVQASPAANSSQVIKVVVQYRDNKVFAFNDAPQDLDRQKTLTLNASIDANGVPTLVSASVEEVTFYATAAADGSMSVTAGTPSTYVYTCGQ
jgi:hypothetical protein